MLISVSWGTRLEMVGSDVDYDVVSVVMVPVVSGDGVILSRQWPQQRRTWGLALFGVEDDFGGFSRQRYWRVSGGALAAPCSFLSRFWGIVNRGV